MAWLVSGELRVMWVAEGAGGANFSTPESNIAGIGSGLAGGARQTAQMKQYLQAEVVIPTAASPTQANFQTAVTLMATDLNTQLTATEIAQFVAWKTGGN